jgi:histidyl-tRNA synthetase
VRGLDYYCHTAWEFVTTKLGAQGTVLAGGRYDGLIEQLGGPATPGIGWAAGIERLSMLIDAPVATYRTIAIVPMGEAAEAAGLALAHQLRKAGFTVEQAFRGNMKKRMARAAQQNAVAAIIIGESELANDVVSLKDFSTGSQSEVGLSMLVTALEVYR